MTDAEAIRELIIRWAFAVRTGDLETVLADHDPGIVMSTCRRGSSTGSDRAPQFAETAGRSQFSPLYDLCAVSGQN
jgi:ketosteroid isomerase-like protein